ncbi:MAG TPA: hypothetical protein VGS09_01225 [Actinomycetota bacterium]|jgi:hypothetical protein|nr:hypothetical protein [Actinomycetota bacterium]
MKMALVILLVVLVVLIGLPLAMGMTGPGFCPDCQAHGPPCPAGVCSAVLALFALVAPGLAATFQLRSPRARRLLLTLPLDKPPRLA